MMLLPSPLPSEPFLPPTQITRPTLKLMGAYQSQSHSATGTLHASCRALQHILNTTPILLCQSKPLQTTPSRRSQTQPTRTRSSFIPDPRPLRPSTQHSLKKRRRDEYESDSCDRIPISNPILDQENYKSSSTYSTPKRRRRTPLSMPLGLCAADFHSLHATPGEVVQVHLDMPLSMPSSTGFPIRSDSPTSPTSPTMGTFTGTSNSWTAADDSALVSTVLEKLQLSRHEWNDCARILGKDKDSLGRRWRMLVGDGEVGLRRGQGRRGRVGLDLGSW